MKKCTTCKIEKPLTEFNIQRKGTPDGHTYKCKPCAAAYTREWSLRNKERIKESARRRYLLNPESKKMSARNYRESNKEKVKAAHQRWAANNQRKIHAGILRRLYGLSIEAYESMFRAQNGCCKICERQNLDGKRLFVDHDHNTGTVRGLLCHHCNAGIGHFFDDPFLFQAAIKYLTENSKEPV